MICHYCGMPARPGYWDAPDDTPTCLNGHSFNLIYAIRNKVQVVRNRTQSNLEKEEAAKLLREGRTRRWLELKKQLILWEVTLSTVSRYLCEGDHDRLYAFERGCMSDLEEAKIKLAIEDWQAGKLTKEFLVNNFGNFYQQRSKRVTTGNVAKTF